MQDRFQALQGAVEGSQVETDDPERQLELSRDGGQGPLVTPPEYGLVPPLHRQAGGQRARIARRAIDKVGAGHGARISASPVAAFGNFRRRLTVRIVVCYKKLPWTRREHPGPTAKANASCGPCGR